MLKQSNTLACTTWKIWKGRNAFVFQHRALNPLLTINQAMTLHVERWKAMRKEHKPTSAPKQNHPLPWRPPSDPLLKCNVDAYFYKEKNIGAIIVMIRDNSRKLITMEAHKVLASLILMAEAMAVREGMKSTNNCLCAVVILESNYLN